MRGNRITPYLFVLPALLLMGVFIYYPIVQNFFFSFYRMSAFSQTRTFIGLDNYTRLFTDSVISVAVWNNLLYSVISILCQVGFGLVVALLLEGAYVKRMRSFFRTVFYLPSMMSITVAGILFTFIYRPDIGLLNSLLRLIGQDELAMAWLGNSTTAIFAIIAMSQWQYTGYITMLLIVAIQKVPEDLYEASEIDGATPFQKAVFITIPQIKDMIVVTCIITIIGGFKVFNEVQVMTQGGPGTATQVLGTYIHRTAWLYDEVGYAATVGVLMFTITFIASVIQLRISGMGRDEVIS